MTPLSLIKELAEDLDKLSRTLSTIVEKEVDAPAPSEDHTEPEPKKTATVTIEEVRAVLAEKSRDGKTQQIKALLTQLGADKLSSVPKDKLQELKEKAEVL